MGMLVQPVSMPQRQNSQTASESNEQKTQNSSETATATVATALLVVKAQKRTL